MLRFRVRTLAVGVLAFVLTELGRELYRPWVQEHGIDDLGIAATLGNTLGTVAAIFVVLGVSGRNRPRDYGWIGIVTFGLMLYELVQAEWDPRDLVATLVAGAFSLGLFRLLNGTPFREPRARADGTDTPA